MDTATGGPAATASETVGDAGTDPAAPTGTRMRVEVVGERPHDASAFTQGLELDDGRLFESRGLYGSSAVTEIDPMTGEVLDRADLGEEFFGEGLTVVDGRIIQITWREQTAFVHDPETLETIETLSYEGEGWGICDADDVLHMSDGTATLTTRDPATLAPLREVTVTLDGQPVERLNELECAGGVVWANVWQTNTIVAIDPATGEVVGTVDASPIARGDGRWAEDPASTDVLNGIAWDPQAEVWLVTGKLWPVTYEVELACVEGCVDADDDVALVLPYHPRPDSRRLARPGPAS